MSTSSFTQDGYANLTAPELIPENYRVQHWDLIRSFDRKFSPVLTDVLPMTEAPDGGAQRFLWPIYTSSKPMARMYDAEEQVKYIAAPAINIIFLQLENIYTCSLNLYFSGLYKI